MRAMTFLLPWNSQMVCWRTAGAEHEVERDRDGDDADIEPEAEVDFLGGESASEWVCRTSGIWSRVRRGGVGAERRSAGIGRINRRRRSGLRAAATSALMLHQPKEGVGD